MVCEQRRAASLLVGGRQCRLWQGCSFRGVAKSLSCPFISTRQVDEFLALCAHARQDVAARYPSAAVPFFIAGERVPQGTVEIASCGLAVYSTSTGPLLVGG